MKKTAPPVVHNNTTFTVDEVKALKPLGDTTNKWRQRNIILFQHPNDADRVISYGTTFDGGMIVIADELKTDWIVALDYASRGKVYVSN